MSYFFLSDSSRSGELKIPLNGRIQKRTVNIKDPYRPDAVVNCWADDTGVRNIRGVTDFCMARDMHDDPALAKANIDFAQRRYHYIRDFRRLGESDTYGYFAGRAVLMPWCIKAFWDCVEYGAQYDMRWQVSNGYQYTSEQQRLDFEGAWATEGQNRGLSKYLFLVECDNEAWQNGWLRYDLEKQKAEGRALDKLWKSIFNPCPYITIGAPENEDPQKILDFILSDWVSEIHTERDRIAMVKHVFALWYMEGMPGRLVTKDKIYPGPWYCDGEPTPAYGGPDDFMGTTDPGAQIAQYSMANVTGQTLTYFDGWDVRSPEPLWVDAPTIESWPAYMMNVAEDVCIWPPVHGGSVWHWGGNNGSFVTVLDEFWYAGYYPPKPIDTWTAYGPQRGFDGKFYNAGTVIKGTGKLVLPSRFGGALITGQFK